MSIQDFKHLGLFRVDVLRLILGLPHREIAEHCIAMTQKAGSYTTYANPEVNNEFIQNMPAREQFEADLKAASDEFVKRTDRQPFAIGGGHNIDYWCSVYRRHDQHSSHFHGRSLVSGTYYPMTSTKSASILLEAPWMNHTMHDTIDVKQMLFEYKPDPGDLLMWPSWLNHRVEPQGEIDIPRIAISFNIDYVHEPGRQIS